MDGLHNSQDLVLLTTVQFTLCQSRAFLDRSEGIFLQFIALSLEIIQKFFVFLSEEVDLLNVGLFVDQRPLIPNALIYMKNGVLLSMNDCTLLSTNRYKAASLLIFSFYNLSKFRFSSLSVDSTHVLTDLLHFYSSLFWSPSYSSMLLTMSKIRLYHPYLIFELSNTFF